MKMMTLKLPDDLDERLSTAAKRQGTTKSALVRSAIESLLNGKHRVAKGRSFLELAGDIIGSVEGPEDLSTNPKYMEGFGRSRRER